MKVKLLMIDMGGVLLGMAGTQGLPEGRLDYRGREAMVRVAEGGGARVRLEDLDEWLFNPWRAAYDGRYERAVEASWTPHLERFSRHTGFAGDPLDLLAAWFRPYAESVAVLPGVTEALAALDRTPFVKVLVSNVPLPGELYRRVLEQHGLADSFDHLYFSYDEGHRKPSPAMLRKALDRYDCEPRSAVMVGDRCSADGVAARASGVLFVWIRSDYAGKPKPDWVIDSFADLPALAASWMPQSETGG